ncbi:hypothetical protein LJA01_27490 [Lactobacillus japonicus]|nr:hypothetical protein LJA01_27490 [Lactobacillus japonicus]
MLKDASNPYPEEIKKSVTPIPAIHWILYIWYARPICPQSTVEIANPFNKVVCSLEKKTKRPCSKRALTNSVTITTSVKHKKSRTK